MEPAVRGMMFRFGFLQWCFWSTYLSFGSFVVYYLTDKGYAGSSIGTFLFAMTLMGIIGQSLLGYVCDRKRTVRRVYIFSMLLLLLPVLTFPLYSQYPLLVVVGMGIFGFFWFPQQSIIDSWIIGTSNQLAQNYGAMRAGGSIGFALLAMVFGHLIDRFGWNIMFVSYGFYSLISIAIAANIADGYNQPRSEEDAINPLILFKIPEYVVLVIVSLLVFASNQMSIMYLPAILSHVGGTPVHQGHALFVIAISEVPFFFLARYFVVRFQAAYLILVAIVFFIARFAVLFAANTPDVVILSGLLNALSFAVYLPTIRYYIGQIAPKGLSTSAQSIATGIFLGGGGLTASMAGGQLVDRFGPAAMLLACLILGSGAFVLQLAWIVFRKRRHPFERPS